MLAISKAISNAVGKSYARGNRVGMVTPQASLGPEAFSFTDVTGVEVSTVTESNAITVAGVTAIVHFLVTGGTAQVNGAGSWLASGAVSNGDTIKVRGTSSAEYGTAVNVVLNINGISDTFSITTAAPSSYIVDEEFETGSIPSGWSAGNTVTWNYATSPAPLFGSYSVYPANSTSYAIASFTAANEIYVTFAMQQSGADINLEVLRLYNGTTSLGNTLIGSDGSLRSIATGGTSSNGGAADLAYATTTYIKTRFITNGTSNTTVTTWSSLDGYTWVLESSCTNGTGTLPVDVIKLRGGSGSSRIFDRVKISTTDIDDAR